ncbi:unnamed protein product [Medioppia subpectinata]|uniref:Uncharacterized protein n=1 Tax=Medioppia subpectinata TaxID=1979941 RepID=A0A7R9LDF5_9ACAR|nr:unnamed protein product [Medioppia subpectinata]CAG2117917.1 unnamed protein product [Medioppia subpectinata]
MTEIKSKKCLSNGLWNINEPICETNGYNDHSLPSTVKESLDFKYLLPFYIIAAITSLVIITIAIIGLNVIMKRNVKKDSIERIGVQKESTERTPYERRCPSKAPDSCVTDESYLDDVSNRGVSLFQYQYEYQNQSEPLYDIPPNSSKAIPIVYDRHVSNSEAIYDRPKYRYTTD